MLCPFQEFIDDAWNWRRHYVFDGDHAKVSWDVLFSVEGLWAELIFLFCKKRVLSCFLL